MPFTLLSLLATLVTSPTTRKTLLALLTIYFLRLLSRTLSSQIRNSWSRQRPWDNSRELVLITGGCSGIGKQIMLDLAARGVTVIIIDVKEPDFELPQTVTFHSTDVTSPSSLHSLHTHILSTHQRPPTVLINNAGIGLPNSILATPPSTIQQTFAVNTISHFWTAREFLPPMLKANHGHIVTVASMASFIGLGGMAPYSCSKASAMAFHEALGQELKLWYRADKVRTSIVFPYWVRTGMVGGLTGRGGRDVGGMPVMDVEVVSGAVVKLVLGQRSGQVILPEGYGWLGLLRGLPEWMQERVRGRVSRMLREVEVRKGA
ncbi:hypothetical protein PABG_07290 [Paracoccidioides brasiliensis Pb03]|nr:hypothetical protein PABG_07290 [Paracoccidioides brasiliensis Pb03]